MILSAPLLNHRAVGTSYGHIGFNALQQLCQDVLSFPHCCREGEEMVGDICHSCFLAKESDVPKHRWLLQWLICIITCPLRCAWSDSKLVKASEILYIYAISPEGGMVYIFQFFWTLFISASWFRTPQEKKKKVEFQPNSSQHPRNWFSLNFHIVGVYLF